MLTELDPARTTAPILLTRPRPALTASVDAIPVRLRAPLPLLALATRPHPLLLPLNVALIIVPFLAFRHPADASSQPLPQSFIPRPDAPPISGPPAYTPLLYTYPVPSIPLPPRPPTLAGPEHYRALLQPLRYLRRPALVALRQQITSLPFESARKTRKLETMAVP